MAPPTDHVCGVRGDAVASTLHYISREFGDSSLVRTLKEIGPGAGFDPLALLEQRLDQSVFVPVPLLVELMQRTGERYLADAGGAPELAERLGAFGAFESQPVLRRLVLQLASPEALIRRAEALWSHYYTCGRLRAEQTGPRSGRLSIEGFHAAHPLWCRRVRGYMRELLRRSSGREVHIEETACAAEGAPRCDWEGDWSGASLF